MARKTTAKKTSRKSTARKTSAKKTTARSSGTQITEALVKRVYKARKKGDKWDEIMKRESLTPKNVGDIRAAMRALDPDSVQNSGPRVGGTTSSSAKKTSRKSSAKRTGKKTTGRKKARRVARRTDSSGN